MVVVAPTWLIGISPIDPRGVETYRWLVGPFVGEGDAVTDRFRVECVNKTDRPNPHERIRRIGGVSPNGSAWRLTQEEAIAGIEAHRWAFFVERPARETVEVVVAVSRYGNKYLKTTADGEQPNNLLSLPECS
jgi:Protein of unknown function (DUF3892)